MNQIKHFPQIAKQFILTRKELVIGVAFVLAIIAIIAAIALLVQSSKPNIVYQPAKACELLNISDAQSLMGTATFNSQNRAPVVSGDLATSNCGYTDGNTDTENLIVAAIMVRSAINDNGNEQNRTEFKAGRPSKNIQVIDGVGDSAYFNENLGQLNILDGNNWIILSYGLGSEPQANTIEQVLELANVVIVPKTVVSNF